MEPMKKATGAVWSITLNTKKCLRPVLRLMLISDYLCRKGLIDAALKLKLIRRKQVRT
ncbi:hypothetical protein PO124_35045 [Bacillus licheniformis]|nr:hypothetical protein [Bacillus licheniformis]